MRALAIALVLAGLAGPAWAQSPGAVAGPPVAGDSALIEPLRRLHDAESRLESEPNSLAVRLERLGALYLVAVGDEGRVREGLAVIDSVRERFRFEPGDTLDTRLLGYAGAFTVLRAKHSFWPHQKLRHVNDGLRALDEGVEREPDDATLRYLRLMSGFYLPSLFGRGGEVQADLAALARLLPNAASHFPGGMHRTVARFVLDHANLDSEDRQALEAIGGARD